MKSCPTCNRTFEDTFTFCLVDGSILSAPFDPRATEQISQPRDTTPPPTLVMPPQDSPNSRDALPPTMVVPQAGYGQQPIHNASPYQQPQQPYQQPQQFFPGLAARSKPPAHSYILAVVAGLLTIPFIEILGTVLHIFPYFLLYGMVIYRPLSVIVFSLFIYGAVGLLFGLKWPQARWKWGLWLTILPAICLTILGFRHNSYSNYYNSLSPIFYLLLLPAACLGARWGSKRGQHKSAR